MAPQLAIRLLIESRCRELGLSRGAFAKQTRCRNHAKALRRLDQLCSGDLRITALVRELPEALGMPIDTVRAAIEESERQIQTRRKELETLKDAEWRRTFSPHAIITTERTTPQPIFVAALIGVDRILRIDLDASSGRNTFVTQARQGVRDKLASFNSTSGLAQRTLPAFGRPSGFIVNYTPEEAIRYDLAGQVIERLAITPRLGRVELAVGGQSLSASLSGRAGAA